MNIDLFEFTKEPIPQEQLDVDEFEKFLNQVWQVYKDKKGSFWREEIQEEECKSSTQPFFNFGREDFCSRGYVGYIKFGDIEFNLYPKIFKRKDEAKVKNCPSQLLLWLKYGNFRKMPNYDSALEKCRGSVFEILIYLFAKYTTDLFSTSLYQHYETIYEETSFLKGKLDFTNYVKNIACQKRHKFCCIYDSFEFNNKFNQIIKYVSNILLCVAKNAETRNLLYEIVDTLDEVDDIVCTENDCKTVYINKFMEDFIVVLDYCKIFLSNCVSINQSGNFKTFAFLFKTEKLYEDFISNYIKREICPKGYFIKTQQQIQLTKNGGYEIKPDIVVYKEGVKKPIKIIDVKYKNENEKGVSKGDIYQCVTYGYKLGCSNLTLLYPLVCEKQKRDSITIKSGFKDHLQLNLDFSFINSTDETQLRLDLNNILQF